MKIDFEIFGSFEYSSVSISDTILLERNRLQILKTSFQVISVYETYEDLRLGLKIEIAALNLNEFSYQDIYPKFNLVVQ